MRNTILANSASGADCVRLGTLDEGSVHNVIVQNEGCGTPLSTADPLLGRLDLYNGPTPTLPLDSASPALNWGDNASDIDENGERLVWDQRGNGDPRDVAGVTDIGAFESQYKVDLAVDTPADDDHRACTPSIPEDCSLRGALALANASPRLDRIRFALGVTVSGRFPRYNLVERVDHVGDNIRIGVFVDGDAGSGVRDENGGGAGWDVGMGNRFLDVRGDVPEFSVPAGANLERTHKNPVGSRFATRQSESRTPACMDLGERSAI